MLAKHDTGTREAEATGQSRADPEDGPSSMSRTGIPRGPYWLLMQKRDSAQGGYAGLDEVRSAPPSGLRDSVLFLEAGGEKVLPVFCSEEAADLFLASYVKGGYEGGYEKRRTWAAELLSVLSASAYASGPCAGVEKVALDPSHETGDDSWDGLACMDRRCFQEHLMGRGASWFRDKEGRA